MAATSEKSTRPVTCRMFETPLIEAFSRVHPAAPFLFWTPFLFYFLFRAYDGGLALALIPVAVLAGVLLWSITEYLLHRFVFHRITGTFAGRRLYFVLHGVHHDYPTDGSRLVMPLGVSIPMGTAVYLLLRVALAPLGGAAIDGVFVGFGVGYLAYDGIHYATHHFRMKSKLGSWLKRYHMVHHHTGENARWGVSSPLWDWVFGTMGETTQKTATLVDR
jgi:sterol desaturase/sphingolipid hydroxylase (fatty acid hydroxylase superfamily)